MKERNVKWSQFPVSDSLPPSSCEETAVCFTASAVTYQQTYFHWLVLLSVIQCLEKKKIAKKKAIRLMFDIYSLSNLALKSVTSFCVWV